MAPYAERARGRRPLRLVEQVVGYDRRGPAQCAVADAVGMAFMQEPLRHTFSLTGAVLWLGIVTVIAGLASWLPARRAVRLTVREVLAYD